MKVISFPLQTAFTIKKSKFLCFAYFVQNKDEIKDILNKLKKQYADASHICYAYVLDDKTYYYTDGGEPSGSAGKPIYGAILSNKLNYTLVVVIRYFGGIKFGPGPLRATFKDISLKTLHNAKIKTAVVTDLVEIHVAYNQLKQIKLNFKNAIYQEDYQHEYVSILLVGDSKTLIKQLSSFNIVPISIKENQVV